MDSEQCQEYTDAMRWDYVNDEWKQSGPLSFRVAVEPFAKGGLRAAYHARLGVGGEALLVAKRFLKEDEDSRDAYRRDVKQQSIAHGLGVAFNSYNPPKMVDFLPAFLIVVGGGALTYLCEEKLPEGKFVKHNDNAGFVTPEMRNTPHAFSHFSWIRSNRTLLISDVQGVGDHYTDPGIHSIDKGFGYTDLGVFGVAFFFSSHECNSICKALGLPAFVLPEEGKVTADPSPSSPNIALRRGQTLPTLTRHVSLAAVKARSAPKNIAASRLVGCSHAGLVLPPESDVPMEGSSLADVHFALGVLHESGRLAMLHEALQAAADGKDTIPVVKEKPNYEAALFHYQMAAFLGAVEAMMVMAMIHAGFTPRDWCAEIEFTDADRAIFFLKLAAARGNRNALLHLGDMNFAQGKFGAAADFYEKATKAAPVPAVAAPSEDEVDTLGLLQTKLPTNVWNNSVSIPSLYARIGEAYERLGTENAKAAEWYSSASEEAFADPLMAKKAMMWSEKAASLE